MSAFAAVEVDPAVTRQLIRGERAAQEAIYRAYADAVYTLTRRVLRDAGLAEEATQDTFVNVIEQAHKLKGVGALGGWIRRIAVNQCLMRLRSPWHRRQQPLIGDEAPAAERGALAPRTEELVAVDGIGLALDVDRALGSLPGTARLVVWMYCVEGYTHREIGKAFGRSASFSKSQLARACRALAAWQQNPQPSPPKEAGRRHVRAATAIV